MSSRHTGNDRKELSEKVKILYDKGLTLTEIAYHFEISYGKAHALLKEAGGTARRRGNRGGTYDPVLGWIDT